ncbi:MAG: hypothetical protein II961_06415 [Candidatus Riflebacteria bacterium]|nr:hypothetical protein [Candidatus Riflebacteria bacterium]
MNKKTISIFFLYLLFGLSLTLNAQTPGTSSDPLVTKSYLDFAAKLRSVEVKSGTTVNAETGALIIVMSGQLKLELKKGGFVIDLTNGRKLGSNTTLQVFHLIMVPNGSLCSFKARKDSSLMAMGISDDAE